MRYLLFFVITLLAVSGYAQVNPSMAVRVDPNKPTVYLAYDCQDGARISLRMVNNTIWHVGVETEKTYFRTKKPITLFNGNKGYAILPGEVVNMHYYVEKDPLEKTNISAPKLKELPQWGGGRIASGDTIFFYLSAEHLQKGLRVYVEFNYEWEVSRSGGTDNEPTHRAYFRGGDISSANTGIMPRRCTNPY
jgi:hypothetical protein